MKQVENDIFYNFGFQYAFIIYLSTDKNLSKCVVIHSILLL